MRDLKTSHPYHELSDEVFKDLESEHAKDLSLWFEFGLDIENIEQVIEALKQSQTKQTIAA